MRVEITKGTIWMGGENGDRGYFCPERRSVSDSVTGAALPDLDHSGSALSDPFDPSRICLDNPATASTIRIVIVGAETAESRENRAGYDRGFYGKRAASDGILRGKSQDWIFGYVDGRRDRA